MKTLNKEELKAVAADVFKRYKKAQKVAVTSDGMAFITDEGENAVRNHSLHNRHKKELQITRFNRDNFQSEPTIKKAKTADELIAEIEDAETVTTVEHIRDSETKGKGRKTVLDAADARIDELKSE